MFLVDFGFSKKLSDKTWTLCGTPEYVAPEVILKRGYGVSVDWWATGILVYEMLVGYPPFWAKNMRDLYGTILKADFDWPEGMELDPVVKSFVGELLTRNVRNRLGCGEKGSTEVKTHSWIHKIDWEKVEKGGLQPPIVPILSGKDDSSNYQDYPEDAWWEVEELELEEMELFRDF